MLNVESTLIHSGYIFCTPYVLDLVTFTTLSDREKCLHLNVDFIQKD
jgi:hypothetical protein